MNRSVLRLAAPVLLAAGLLGLRAPREAARLTLVETAPVETELAHAGWPRTDQVWLDMIGGARETLELAHFYASDRPGSRLGPIVEALEAAADRGVRVRFLADAKFHETYPETLDRLGAHDGIELRLLDLRPLTGGVLHAKYMIADGAELFLGSPNFDWRSLEEIQELGARLASPEAAAALRQVFEGDWARAGGEEVAPDELDAAAFPVTAELAGGGTVRVTPVFSPRPLLADDSLWDLPRLVAAIDGAERRVRVQLLTYQTVGYDRQYFDVLESALRRAAARGVQVQLLLADWCKRQWTIEGLQSLQCLPRVEVRLSTIPQAAEGFIPYARVAHAKYMVVDSATSWIGTSNWSSDYFHASRNVGLFVEGSPVATRLDAFFDSLWSSELAEAVDPCARYEPPRVGD